MSTVGLIAASGLRSRRRSGVIATLLVLVLAAIAMTAGLAASSQGGRLLDQAAAEVDVAHLVLYGDRESVAAAADEPDVVASAGPFDTLGDVELLVGDQRIPMQLTVLESPDIDVNRPLMRSGEWLGGADEIVLDQSVGADLGLTTGDDIVLLVDGVEATYRIVGTAVSFTDCFYPQCEPGRAWVSGAGLDRLGAEDQVISQGWFRFDDPERADVVVERQAAAGIEGIRGSESWLDTRGDFLILDRIFGSFIAAFGVFVLVVAAVVIAGSTAVRVVSQRRMMGLLGAIGCTRRQIAGGLLVEQLAIGVVAGVIGWFLGGFLAPSLQIGIGRSIGAQGPAWSLTTLALTLGAIVVLLTLATIIPASAAARRPVTDVLRDVPPDRVSVLNRLATHVPRRLSAIGALETAGQPTRAALAALALVVAIVGLLVSAGFVSGIESIDDDPARAGDPWDLVVLPGDMSEGEVGSALADTAGVSSWFSEVNRRSSLDGGAFLSVAQGGDLDGYRIADGRAPSEVGEAMAGYGFLDRFGVAVGDRVAVLAGTTPMSLEIVGMYRETEDSGEVLRYRLDDLTAADPTATPDAYRVVTDDGAADAVGAALLERLGPTVRIEQLDTGVHDMAPMLSVLRTVAGILLAMAAVNLFTTLVTTNREAAGRVGVELAIGFTPRQIVVQGVIAGITIGLVAIVIGLPLGYWTFGVLADTVSRSVGVGNGWMPVPDAVTALVIALIALAASGALGALAVRGVARRPAAELLRGE